MSIKNQLYRQFEKACMCFKTRQASTPNYKLVKVLEFILKKPLLLFFGLQSCAKKYRKIGLYGVKWP